MSKKDDDEFSLFKVRPAAMVLGGKRPPQDTSMIPPVVGETVRLQVRVDNSAIGDIQEHLDRLRDRAPHTTITVSDVLRSLIARGARAFREDEERAPDNDDE